MQTNAAWVSPEFAYYSGASNTPTDISGWTLEGVAVGAKGQRVPLTINNDKVVVVGTNKLKISLSKTDMRLLGVGEVKIEVMRSDPAPVRPVLVVTGMNNEGIAA